MIGEIYEYEIIQNELVTKGQRCPVKEIIKLDLNPLICYYGFAYNS